MLLTPEEIASIEMAINCAVKQASIMMTIAVLTPTNAPMKVQELLEANSVYLDALKAVQKLKDNQ